MKRNKRHHYLAILLFFLAIFLWPKSSRDSIYHFIRWQPVEDIIFYRIEIKNQNGKILRRKDVRKTYFSVLGLKKGRYQCRIAALDVFRKPLLWSGWQNLEIRIARTPRLAIRQPIQIDNSNPKPTIAIPGKNLSEATRVKIHSGKNKIPIIQKKLQRQKLTVQLNLQKTKPGNYDLTLTNPYGKKTTRRGIIIIEKEKQEQLAANEPDRPSKKKTTQSKKRRSTAKEPKPQTTKKQPAKQQSTRPDLETSRQKITHSPPKDEKQPQKRQNRRPGSEKTQTKPLELATRSNPESETKKSESKPPEPKSPESEKKSHQVISQKSPKANQLSTNSQRGLNLNSYLAYLRQLQFNCTSTRLPDQLIKSCYKNYVLLKTGNRDRKDLYNFLKTRSKNYFSRIQGYQYFAQNCSPPMLSVQQFLQQKIQQKKSNLDDTEKTYILSTLYKLNKCR